MLAACALGACTPAPGDNASANRAEPVPVATPTAAARQPDAPPPAATKPHSARYRCFDGSRLVADFVGDRVTVRRAGKSIVLRQERVAAGIRYANGRTILSGQGDTLSYETPDQPPLVCTVIR